MCRRGEQLIVSRHPPCRAISRHSCNKSQRLGTIGPWHTFFLLAHGPRGFIAQVSFRISVGLQTSCSLAQQPLPEHLQTEVHSQCALTAEQLRRLRSACQLAEARQLAAVTPLAVFIDSIPAIPRAFSLLPSYTSVPSFDRNSASDYQFSVTQASTPDN